jgi:hypothetical protein
MSAVIASTGERSSSAFATPSARFIAPGPTVAMQTPGRPVIWPVTSAMSAALASWPVR